MKIEDLCTCVQSMHKQGTHARACLFSSTTWPQDLHFTIIFQHVYSLKITFFGTSPYSCGSVAGTVSASPKTADVAVGWPAAPKCSEEEELTGFDSEACGEAVCGQLLCQVRLFLLLPKETGDEEEPLLQNHDISLQREEK